jgi:exopolysaccharide biosynthesis protein
MERMKRHRVLRTVVLDLLLTGAVLVVFALFHHVFPRDVGYKGEPLPGDLSPTANASATPGASSPTTAPTSDPAAPSITATPTSGATPSPRPTVFTDTSFESATLSISITSFQRDGATGYVADIRTADPLALRSYFAGGSYALGRNDWPLDMAEEAGALLAINGDYYGIRSLGIVVRDGVLYRETLYRDVLVMYRDGTMATFDKSSFDVAALKTSGAWQAWSFGPMLLTAGQPMTVFNSDVPAANPRSAIGYYEPGHYCFVVVDGRQPGYSSGMTLKQLSQFFFDLGCKVAYNFDGGQSSEMVFRGVLVNRPYNGGRHVSDIVYVGVP